MDKYAEDFRKEIVIMQDLDHENIVKFYGIYRGGKPSCHVKRVFLWFLTRNGRSPKACHFRGQLLKTLLA